jgi:hypothetical protein
MFGQIKDIIRRYLELQLKLLKLSFIGATANVVGYLLFTIIGILLMFGIVLFVGFGLTEEFVELGLSRPASYFLVVGIYLLLLAIIVMSRKTLVSIFAGKVIKVLTDDEVRHTEDED